MENFDNIPLFPLGLVLLPGMILPLHIFEERYKLMIKECIDKNKNFGIIFYSGEKFNLSGCTAKIMELSNIYDDGRMDILVEGEKRFKTKFSYNDKPYLEADIEYFDDEYETEGEALELARTKGIKVLKEIMDLYAVEEEKEYINNFDSKFISFLIATNGGFTLEEKQAFLEMINTRERLEKGIKSLENLIERLRAGREIEKIIKSNGYLPSKH